jgi:hypothetical protein
MFRAIIKSMRKSTEVPQLHWGDELKMMVSFLNDGEYGVLYRDEAFREELRALAKEWLAAKANWSRFLKKRLLANKPVFTRGTFYISAQGRTPVMIPSGLDEGTEAQGAFLQFILHPDHRQLAGPCLRDGCGRYFLRKTAHPKVYCSSRCASLDTAIDTMRRKRKDIHDQLVDQTKIAIARWERKPVAKITWEEWVAREVEYWVEDEKRDWKITPRMIRGWVENEELKPPVGRTRNA